MSILASVDPEIAKAIQAELVRQQTKLELIASENFVSKAVLEAQGSVLTNKYAEGYPGNRYYGGCENMDTVETLAIERAKTIFGAEYANVQPHSGAQANTAVYFAFLQPGDLIMGLSLAHGGHLTHGSPVNISGKYFKVIPYGVDPDTHMIQYEQVRELALKHKPKMLVAGASAYPRKIDFARLGEIAKEAGALFMVDMAHVAGLVAAGLHPNPVPYADIVTTTTHKTLRGPRGGLILCREKYGKAIDKAVFPGIQGGPLMHIVAAKAVALKEAMSEEFNRYQEQIIANAHELAAKLLENGFDLVSGGTDNHMMLVDVRRQGVTGKEAEKLLEAVGVTVNKNAIPNDPAGPMVTSGIRVGVPAVTSRGMGTEQMAVIAEIITLALTKKDDSFARTRAAGMVAKLCQQHPLYAG